MSRKKLLLTFAAAITFAIIVIINPYSWLDFLLTAGSLIVVGHRALQEKFLLVFLALRPIIDWWRDYTIFEYRTFSFNINGAVAFLFFLWSLGMIFRHRAKILAVPGIHCLVLTGVVFTGSIFYSVYPATTMLENLKFLNLALIFILSYIFVRHGQVSLRQLLLTLAASAIIPVTFGALQALSGGGITTFGIPNRIFGTFAHPNVLAFFLLLLLMAHIQHSSLTPAKYWLDRPRLRLAIYCLLSALLLLTYTRAAWIGLIVFLAVLGIFYQRKLLYIVAGSLALAYVILTQVNQIVYTKTGRDLTEVPLLARVMSRSDEADSLAWRQALVREAMPLVQARPWLGYGYGTFPLVWSDNRPLAHLWDDSDEAHNDYLRLALETGLIGLAIYLAWLSRLLAAALQKYRREREAPENLALIGSLVVFIVISLSDNMLHHSPVMWPWFGLWGAWLATRHERAGINLLRDC